MKPHRIVRLVFSVLVLLPWAVQAQSIPVVNLPTADADLAASDWRDLHTFLSQELPRQGMTARQYYEWVDQQAPEIQKRLQTFYAAHPTSPLRWNAVMMMQQYAPAFITDFGPQFEQKGLAAATIDQAAKAAFTAKLNGYLAAMAAANDVPKEVRLQLEGQQLMTALENATNDASTNWSALHAKIVAFAAKYPDSSYPPSFVLEYMYGFEGAKPAEAAAEWATFVGFPNPGVAAMAADKVKAFSLLKDPIEIAFTAADGRAVDLQQLRGKVVLVDFWATWCGPCKAEIPNVKKIYAAYHDKGFEVVGISLENARLAPADDPARAAAKLAAAKNVLLEFTAHAGMTWPQYFDGKFWKNDISTKYAINAIPAMFLLDQQGRVVSTNARGEKLEIEVKRLLKL